MRRRISHAVERSCASCDPTFDNQTPHLPDRRQPLHGRVPSHPRRLQYSPASTTAAGHHALRQLPSRSHPLHLEESPFAEAQIY